MDVCPMDTTYRRILNVNKHHTCTVNFEVPFKTDITSPMTRLKYGLIGDQNNLQK